MTFYKYQGAGNDFLIADNRDGNISLDSKTISHLCDRHYGIGADGVMLLSGSSLYDFRMEYFNSDGSGGMMCGNGGRCITAFAADLGYTHFGFEAADGFHTAEILQSNGPDKTVRLKMIDVDLIHRYDDLSWRIDTGTRHFVRFVKNLESYDVAGEGRKIRYMDEFSPIGVNANFVEAFPGNGATDGTLAVRTYEKGVEGETYACGTGITASAIAAYFQKEGCSESIGSRVRFNVKALRDRLSVDFVPAAGKTGEASAAGLSVSDVWLTGPASYIGKVIINQ